MDQRLEGNKPRFRGKGDPFPNASDCAHCGRKGQRVRIRLHRPVGSRARSRGHPHRRNEGTYCRFMERRGLPHFVILGRGRRRGAGKLPDTGMPFCFLREHRPSTCFAITASGAIASKTPSTLSNNQQPPSKSDPDMKKILIPLRKSATTNTATCRIASRQGIRQRRSLRCGGLRSRRRTEHEILPRPHRRPGAPRDRRWRGICLQLDQGRASYRVHEIADEGRDCASVGLKPARLSRLLPARKARRRLVKEDTHSPSRRYPQPVSPRFTRPTSRRSKRKTASPAIR